MRKRIFKMKKSLAKSLWILFFATAIYASIAFCIYLKNGVTITIERGDFLSYNANKTNDVVYLSDIPYQKAQIGWGTIGLDKTNSNASLILNIDGASVVVKNPTPLKGVNSAVHVKIDIKDANYIRLYANDNGANGSDHAVWGDAKLVKADYNDNVMMTVEEFEDLLSQE